MLLRALFVLVLAALPLAPTTKAYSEGADALTIPDNTDSAFECKDWPELCPPSH